MVYILTWADPDMENSYLLRSSVKLLSVRYCDARWYEAGTGPEASPASARFSRTSLRIATNFFLRSNRD